MSQRTLIRFIQSVVWLGMFGVFSIAQAASDVVWVNTAEDGKADIHLYFFWSKHCPHCLQAQPYIDSLIKSDPHVVVHSLQLVGEPENVQRYQSMAAQQGQEARSVPAFFVCNTMLTGYSPEVTPTQLEALIAQCRDKRDTSRAGPIEKTITGQTAISIPFVGVIDLKTISSLPMLTVLIAAVDAFNPCAFFVLMFLMSLLVHSGGRGRMFLVGGLFVFCSGLMYFLFMSAWLNLFQVVTELDRITLVAGLLAIAIGAINIKDFFLFKRGVSLSIPDKYKPNLYKRMHGLMHSQSMLTLVFATVGLALFANLYEFLCTAGFPMVYTRILTLHDLPDGTYYAYLLLYNIIYILPLLIIVAVFAWFMGARKLQETEGRRLKMLSGAMMLALGVVLVVNPLLLQNIATAFMVLLVALLIAGGVIWLESRRVHRSTST